MSKPARGPLWTLLYALLPLLGGLFFLESRSTLPAWGHRAAQVGIVLFVFGLVERWIHWNEAALVRSELKEMDRKRPLIIYVWEPWSAAEIERGFAQLSALDSAQYPVAALPLPDEYDPVQALSICPDNVTVVSGRERNA